VNPRCPDHPDHRPHLRLTCKVNGKTVTESFATSAEQRKAEKEIETFRHYRQLERSFVEVNEKIWRPAGGGYADSEGKKGPKRSIRRTRAK
jgi:hypothetical protein